MTVDVGIIGSVNHDITVFTARHPRPGETVLGTGHRSGGGGKGANQAVAAARLGGATALIARLGDDEQGRALLSSLDKEGIDVEGVSVDHTSPTGLAVITVDEQAENSIVVSPGANMTLGPEHVRVYGETLSRVKVAVAQLEIPIETVAAAARTVSGMFVLNPAPAQELPPELLQLVDILVPNRSELATLSGAEELGDRKQIAQAARMIERPSAVIVTLGSEGALVVNKDQEIHVSPPQVDPVDTTGAGDAFCGALAVALSEDRDLVEAAEFAALAGGLATTRHGAQEAMPTRADMEARR